MKKVRLCHPDLPDRVIEVAESGVPFRRAAGWVFAPAPPPPEPEPDDSAPEPDDEPEKAAPRRRRKTKEE